MSGRPGEEYRVRARIEARSGRRRWLLLLVAAVVVAGWIGITANAPKFAATPRDTARATSPPDGIVVPTEPPLVEIRQPDEPMGVIPVIVGGLGWLDPARGTLQGATLPELGQWLFALPEGGTAFVCFDVAADGGSSLHLYLFDRTGTLLGARTVSDWTPP
ncbi:MAG TPA: hypothetical protein VNH13_08140, partial [Candidatus Acidoferrales bacterium]|nr:hypothetical protein [Candidatus Acidoferrales bacterium]